MVIKHTRGRGARVLVLSILAFILACSIGCNGGGDVERKYRHEFSDSEGCIWAYKSTPKKVINQFMSYIEENGFTGDDIEFTFENKYRDWIDSADRFRFYVSEYYKGIDCGGYSMLMQ